MEQQYMIYKFRQPQSEEVMTEFFLPDKTWLDKIERVKKLAEIRAAGYICSGFVRVNKETYLNARLEETVREFCGNEKYREKVLHQYQVERTMTSQVFFDTMSLIDSFKWSCLHKIEMQVRRLLNSGLEVWSEIALQLYDGIKGNNSLIAGGVQ